MENIISLKETCFQIMLHDKSIYFIVIVYCPDIKKGFSKIPLIRGKIV